MMKSASIMTQLVGYEVEFSNSHNKYVKYYNAKIKLDSSGHIRVKTW